MTSTNPFLLTLTLDSHAQSFFNELRRQHFPAERNFLDAHLMLFHNLPANESQVLTDIEAIATQTKSFTLLVSEVASIGNGVAYKTESPQLQAIHLNLQKQWQQSLIPQDKNKLWPHITIQNKVKPETAKDLLAQLNVDFEPFDITAIGLDVWEYLSGPWKHQHHFKFI
jgi:2'-5' RNA ligase